MIGTKFNKPLETQEQLDAYSSAAEWCNANNAMIEDKGEYYEVVPVPEPTQEEKNAAEIERLKAELASTDYKCLKYVDGALTDEEYAEVKEYRASLRARINELERTE
jgi:hypothetical protein